MYLELNPKLYLLKPLESEQFQDMIIFSGNQASYGGAVYVADNTSSAGCSPNIECFVQTLALHQLSFYSIYTENMKFIVNTATERGANLFGGLLDRCVPSLFAEVYRKQPDLVTQDYGGLRYFQDISNIIDRHSISSPPVRICFCTTNSEPDCSYQPPPIKVKKGETFKVSLVAVDQVNRSVDANIISSLLSADGGLSEGQQTQLAGRNCTDLTFNVLSSCDNDFIHLYAEGPCGSSEISIRTLDIQFLNCTCPVGFQPSSTESTRCQCICDRNIFPYITSCDFATNTIIRQDTNSWITYIN